MPNVMTINEAVNRLKADGFPVSSYTLRSWVRMGKIPARKAGSKFLIYYPNLISYLRCEDGGDNQPATVAAAPGIRRVDL